MTSERQPFWEHDPEIIKWLEASRAEQGLPPRLECLETAKRFWGLLEAGQGKSA